LEKSGNNILALCPGAEYGPAKQWPVSHFAEVATKWHAKGNPVWILGSEKDREIGEQIQRLSKNACENLCGKTKLLDVVDLLSVCFAVVTNDSGLMHVAAASGTKVVVIYGGSDPGHTPPLSTNAEILFAGIACQPCMKRVCKFGHYKCLVDINSTQVLNLLEKKY
jgi:heptosyltransferase-2